MVGDGGHIVGELFDRARNPVARLLPEALGQLQHRLSAHVFRIGTGPAEAMRHHSADHRHGIYRPCPRGGFLVRLACCGQRWLRRDVGGGVTVLLALEQSAIRLHYHPRSPERGIVHTRRASRE